MGARGFAASVLASLMTVALLPLPAAALDQTSGDGSSQPTTIYLAGDSTVASYSPSAYPLMGWGQKLDELFTDDVVVDNRALGGRSSKSYVLEGHLDEILADIQPGDYLFVQFGHNDRQNTDSLCPANPAYCNRHTDPYTSFKEYLQKYIDGALAHEATPVLVTPMGRRNYNDDGSFNNDFYDYAQAMKQLSAENDVPLIDLNSESIAFYTRIGPPATEEIFLYTEPMEYDAYPTGREDNVHFQEYGAGWLARFVAEGVVEGALPVAEHVRLPNVDPWNLGIGATVSASSSLEADWWYRWNVGDGVTDSVPHGLGWSSDNDALNFVDHKEWIQLDIADVMPLSRVVLAPRNDAGNEGLHFPVDFTIQLSEDGESWTTVADIADYAAPTAPKEFTFPETPARYVRVTGLQLRQNPDDLRYRMQLAEIKVYSDVVAAELTGPSELADGATGRYTAALRVPDTVGPIGRARFELQVPEGWSSKQRTRSDRAAGWDVTAPTSGRAASDPPAVLRVTAKFTQSRDMVEVSDELLVGRPAEPVPPPPGQHYVSDLPFVAEVNGWGPVERDMSNGEDGAGDGRPITVGGVEYAKGLGVHADSSVTIALDQCQMFTAVVGVDDEVGNGGSVAFLIEGDGEPLAAVPLQTGSDPGEPVSVDVAGVSQLRLVVDDLGNKGHDHADWADSKVTGCAT